MFIHLLNILRFFICYIRVLQFKKSRLRDSHIILFTQILSLVLNEIFQYLVGVYVAPTL